MNETIGIIDRGVGGLGLFKKLREVNGRPIIYFSDNDSIPYGLIEKSELKKRLDQIIGILNTQGVSKVVLACNSASVVYPDNDDIKGIIKFGVSSLLKAKPENPALIGTTGTVNSGAYKALFEQHDISVIARTAQSLAVHVEKGNISGKELEHDICEIMRPLASCDAILMACTHFPAIKSVLQRYVQPECQLIDPVDEMSSWINNNWVYSPSLDSPRPTQFLITGSEKKFIQTAKTSFDVDINPSQIQSMPLY